LVTESKNENLLPALTDLKRWWTHVNVGGVVIGGVAISFIAGPRFTEDVDCLVDLDDRDWADFLETGRQFGFFPRIDDPLEFAKKSRVLLLLHRPSETTVDISVAGIMFEHETIQRGRPPESPLVDISVATAEDLLVMKAVAQRDKDRVDMAAIVKAHKNLDVVRVRGWAQLFAEGLEEPEILASIERLFSGDEK
jgi:hypothetical protein